MKRIFPLLLVLFFTFAMEAGEWKISKDSVMFGTSTLYIWPNGMIALSCKGQYSSWYLHFTTRHPKQWFSMVNKECGLEKLPSGNPGTWKFQAAIPVSVKEKADARMTLTARSNALEIDCGWNIAHPDNLIETGFFVSFPVSLMTGKNLRINGQDYPVRNETRYGWIQRTVEKPEITFFQGDPEREYTLSAEGKYSIVAATQKNGAVTVRINAPPGANGMKLLFRPK